MKIIKQIKNLIVKNPKLFEIYKKLYFIKDASLKDFLNPQKILLFKKVYPYTMVGYKRLSNVYELAKMIENNKINGAFVECGVWKGGCAAVMAFIAEKAGSSRKTWLFDSFEGLPEPTNEDGQKAKDYALDRAEGELSSINKCVGTIEDVKKIFFQILKLKKENIMIKKGWFQNILPETKREIGPISILRLDGDWYESTKCCLDNLYDLVVPGGYVIIDDYGYWEGAKIAVDDFLKIRQIKLNLIKIDYAGFYFKKL